MKHDPELAARLYARAPSCLEETLALHLKAAGLPAPEPEFRFAPPRRWRFDFCWPDRKLAAECEGGAWTGGRHTRPKGFAADCEKYNAAAMAGWTVLRFTADMVKDGTALQTIEQAIKRKPRSEGIHVGASKTSV